MIFLLKQQDFQYFLAGRAAGLINKLNTHLELVQEITNDNVKEITSRSGSVIEVSGVYKTAKTEKPETGISVFHTLLQQK